MSKYLYMEILFIDSALVGVGTHALLIMTVAGGPMTFYTLCRKR